MPRPFLVFSLFMLASVLSGCSLQDHVSPSNWNLSASLILGGIEMDGSVDQTGSSPAKEYGFVLSYRQNGSDPVSTVPTISDTKVTFTPDKGQTLGIGHYANQVNFSYKDLYFRAYLLLEDGSIVYSNVVESHK